MSNDLTTYKEALLDPGFCDQAMKLALMMAKAETLPAHLKGKPADILRVIEMAHRAGQSPFAVADKTFFVGGKIAFEGQLVAGLVNSHRSIEERLNYEYEGDEDKPSTLKCLVSARLKGEDKRRTVRVTWIQGEAQSKGAKDKWKSQPAQQLAYFGARVWARRHAPEILLGLYTPEELEAGHIGPEHAVDVTPAATGFGRAKFAEPEPDDHDPETGEVIDAKPAASEPPAKTASKAASKAPKPAPNGMIKVWLPGGTIAEVVRSKAVEELIAGLELAKSQRDLADMRTNNPWLDNVPENFVEPIDAAFRDRADAIGDVGETSNMFAEQLDEMDREERQERLA